jgi:hypothetical protein
MEVARYVALLFFLTCLPARAYEIEIGSALVCDTQKQVERFVQLFEHDLATAITTVNSEENNPTACAMTDIVYVQGRQLEMARSAAHTFKIIPIMVIGENSPTGYRSVEPVSSLMLVEIRELAI